MCSDEFRCFLGAWMKHTPELMVFYAPNVNSYKRYSGGSWAPAQIAWYMCLTPKNAWAVNASCWSIPFIERNWSLIECKLNCWVGLCFVICANLTQWHQCPSCLARVQDNRTAPFRIWGSGKSLRIECGLPGADCNVYLAFAAALASGLDGIRKKIEPPPSLEGNIYFVKDLLTVPRSLVNLLCMIFEANYTYNPDICNCGHLLSICH